MSDEQDAPPTRVGQAVTPKAGMVVSGGIGPDGQFFMELPDDEMVGRGLIQLMMFELDRHYSNRRMAAMLEKAQETRVLDGMMGHEKKRIDRRLKG